MNIQYHLRCGLIFLVVFCVFGCASAVKPVAWESPPNPGYTGQFEPNEQLKAIEQFPIGDNEGPEAVAIDAEGRIYASTHKGIIVRLDKDCKNPENWADTGGRPLGISFDNDGNLIVADAFRGLLSITPDGTVAELATVADGIPIRYANDVDVADNGCIYFSDSSTKFGAKENGGTLEACILDMMEHGGHGRLLRYNPKTQKVDTLMKGINYANGVAVSHDQQYVLVNETSTYSVIRYWIAGEKINQSEYLLEQLPSFPDNITTGSDGVFWIALVSPRSKLMDGLSEHTLMRKMAAGLPKFLRPTPKDYGHIIGINGDGEVVYNMQDPEGNFPMITGVCETPDYLYLGSLISPNIGRLKWSD